MSNPRTRDEVLAWGPRKLGGGVVVVELTQQQNEDSWDDAVRWWIARRGIQRSAVAVYSGPGVYTVPSDCETVIEVLFPDIALPSLLQPYEWLGLDVIPLDHTPYGRPWSDGFSQIIQWLQRAEMGQRIMGGEPSWEWDASSRQLRLFPASRSWSGSIVIRYLSAELNDTDPVRSTDSPNDLKRLSFLDLDILLRRYMVELKDRLGHIRNKYPDGLPAAGGTKRMDGSDLLQEVATDKQLLDEELQEIDGPAAPFLG